MDIISHGLWGGITVGRKSGRSFWTAFCFGVAPDLFAFGPMFANRMFIHRLDFLNNLGKPPDASSIPAYVHSIYNLTQTPLCDTRPLLRAPRLRLYVEPACGAELILDEPQSRVGEERAILPPAPRIFGDSLVRIEKPVDIIHRVARCGKGNRERIQRSDALEVRLKVADLGFGVEDREQVARTIRVAWTHAQRGDHGVRNLHRFSVPGRKIHAEQLAVTSDRQVPAAGAEDEALRRRKGVPEENVGGGQGRVTAQVDLHRRREPAQGHDVAARDDKSGLGKIVLGGDSREDAVWRQIV